MTKIDFHQRQELTKLLMLADDEDGLSDAISQLIHDRDASQRLLVEAYKGIGLEPCAKVAKHTGQFKDMSVITWLGAQPPEGTILYAKPGA